MKTTAFTWIAGICLLASMPAFAGAGSSGGGAAIVCRDGNRKITSAELLDLYEGKVRFEYQIPGNASEPREQILAAIEKLNSHARYKPLARQVVAEVISRMRFLPPGVVFQSPEDLGGSYGIVMPDGCGVEGVGFYEADGTLKVSRSIYAAFSKTDQAAFIVHEALYKIARDRPTTDNSAASRQLNAAVFSTDVSSDVIQKMSESLVDGGYDWLFDHNEVISVPGEAHFPLLSIRITPSSSQAYSAQFACTDHSGAALTQKVSFSGTGTTELKLQDLTCYAINGSLGPSEGMPEMKFTVEFYAGQSLLYSRETKSRRADSQFYTEVLHPEIAMPQIPHL